MLSARVNRPNRIYRPAFAGYDAATLYCNSLLHPPTAQRVWDEFQSLFSTRSGRMALLSAACRYLLITDDPSGDFATLEEPLQALAKDMLSAI
jgi:hypothetical protein